ncbi:hypothetical protein K502DRAFT_345342 [Neoconidiobolus thromboides FSU 785]|nr:hypothetical protein K502DRAFT_345342 [Neoconidiobolus thromboides FSU 785]
MDPVNKNTSSENIDDNSLVNSIKNDAIEGMKSLNVIIKLPFKRPESYVPPDKQTWTKEKEAILWEFLNSGIKESKDWQEISERLAIPVSNVIKHSAILYESKTKAIKEQIMIKEEEEKVISRGIIKED